MDLSRKVSIKKCRKLSIYEVIIRLSNETIVFNVVSMGLSSEIIMDSSNEVIMGLSTEVSIALSSEASNQHRLVQ